MNEYDDTEVGTIAIEEETVVAAWASSALGPVDGSGAAFFDADSPGDDEPFYLYEDAAEQPRKTVGASALLVLGITGGAAAGALLLSGLLTPAESADPTVGEHVFSSRQPVVTQTQVLESTPAVEATTSRSPVLPAVSTNGASTNVVPTAPTIVSDPTTTLVTVTEVPPAPSSSPAPEPSPEPQPDPQPQPQPDPEPDPSPEPEPDPEPDPQPDPAPDPDPEPDPQPDPDPAPLPNPELDLTSAP